MDIENNKVDIPVIGAGASGAAFSWKLAKSGIKVMCLEQGDWLDPLADYSTSNYWKKLGNGAKFGEILR